MTHRGVVGACILVVLAMTFPARNASAGGTLLYPNLKTQKPKALVFGRVTIDGADHYVLRLTNVVWNAGEGPVELRAKKVTTTTGQKSRVFQRIYDGSGG